MIAKVLIDSSVKTLNKVYDYIIPFEFENEELLGKRVLVSFGTGKGSKKEGIIVKITPDKKDGIKYKEIEEILDSTSYIDETRLKLAKWIAKSYFCNVYDALKLMLPPSSKGKLMNKDFTGKQVSVIYLARSTSQIEEDIANKKITSARHIKLLRYLGENENIYLDDAINALNISRAVIDTVQKNGYILIEKEDIKEEIVDITLDTKPNLTDEQERTVNSINNKMISGSFSTSLIYGVTGSGKTEVYLRLIEKCLEMGKAAIVLVPEISLTVQTKNRFYKRFGNQVSVLHSKMTILERQTEIKKIITGKSKIVIGPRSALFVNIKDLGLIIIDEEHDTSYISGSTPRYNAKEVAMYLAHLTSAQLVLGSATPEVSVMYKAKEGKIDLYILTKRPGSYLMPSVEVVDMKTESLKGTNKYLSSRLIEEIENRLQKGEQTFLFINRRGFSSNVICKSCGKILKCMNCDVGLTYHRKINLLLCHYCSYAEVLKEKCPYCGCEKLDYSGLGTEKIEEEIERVFPNAKVCRMDADTTVKRGAHEKILNEFKDKKYDILVGTQMISKGHDIPNVTLVGIINADSTFAGNNFLSTEKGFNALLQVSGRAGRGSIPGLSLVQAYDTESYSIEALKENSYDMFYEKEIEFRKLANYPPFTDIVLFELTGKNKQELYEDSNKLYDILYKLDGSVFKVTKPKAPYISRVNNKYKLQIVTKTSINDKVLADIYECTTKYDKIKRRDVSLSVIKNPIYIG